MADWFTFRTITDGDFERPDFRQWFIALVKEAQQKNEQRESEMRQLWLTTLENTKKLYGVDSKEARYIYRASYPTANGNTRREKEVWNRYESYLESKKRRERKAVKEAERAQRRREQEAAEQQRLAEQRAKQHDYRMRHEAAMEALVARGFVPGISFEPGKAITFLKELERDGETRKVELEIEYREYEG